MSWTNKPPVPTDGWSTALPNTQTVSVSTQSPLVPNAWGAFVEEAKVNEHWPITRPDLVHDEVDMTSQEYASPNPHWYDLPINDPRHPDCSQDPERIDELREAVWTANALDSANTKAGVVNALSGNKDQFNIDQDGELTRMQEITKSVSPGPHGYYIAYHNGRWLHAILSGPYESKDAAMLQAPKAYDMMVNDAAFKLAFENTFDRNGIYCAEIPLSAKRKGAYGVIE